MSLKVVFAGTPSYAVPSLRALDDSSHEVVAAYTQPDRPQGRGRKIMPSPVKQFAIEHNIPVFQPKTLREKEASTILTTQKADVMVVVAYGLILPKTVLDAFSFGCINVHFSLLPRWRGAAPVQRAIIAGDEEIGVSIMQMDEGLDTGDLLAKRSYIIEKDATSELVYADLALLGAELLLETLPNLAAGKIIPVSQDSTCSTLAPKVKKVEAEINWQLPAEQIANRVRAFNSWPVAYTTLAGHMLKIWRARVIKAFSDKSAGTLIQADKSGVYVATGDGVLSLLELQLPGGKRISALDFVNSHQHTLQPNKTIFGVS